MTSRFSLFDSMKSAPEEPGPERGETVPVQPETSGQPDSLIRAALATMSDPAWAMDCNGRCLMRNAAFDALDNRISEGLLELAPDKLGATGSEIYDMSGDGGELRLSWSEGGGVTFFQAALREAAGGKPPAPAASAGDARPGEAFDALGLGWALFNNETRLVAANAAYRSMFAVDPAFIAEQPRYFRVLDYLRAGRQLTEQADFRKFREEELELFRRDDLPVEEKIYLPDSRVIRRLVLADGDGGRIFLFEDQTGKMELESDLNAVAAVQQTTLDNLFEAAVLIGSDGIVRLGNARFRELSEEVGVVLTSGDRIHFDDLLAAMIPAVADADSLEALRRNMVISMSDRVESDLRLTLLDGRAFDALTVPLPAGALLLSLLDVTSEVGIRKALEDKAEAFAAADRLKSEFIANVSHEIRTPLTALKGFAEILTGGHFGPLQGRHKEYADAILSSSREVTMLVDDILDLAVVEAGQADLDIDRVDIHALVVGVFRRTQALADRRRVKLTFDVPPDIGWCAVDGRRMQQALYNLVCNAMSMTPPGGRVSLAGWRDDGEGGSGDVVLAVSDSGVGLQGRDPESLFGGFSGPGQTGSAGSAAGIGMTIVRKFVELHGGTVSARDRERQGLIVECRLPANSRG
jgi:signal transduction histidine kinase